MGLLLTTDIDDDVFNIIALSELNHEKYEIMANLLNDHYQCVCDKPSQNIYGAEFIFVKQTYDMDER